MRWLTLCAPAGDSTARSYDMDTLHRRWAAHNRNFLEDVRARLEQARVSLRWAGTACGATQ